MHVIVTDVIKRFEESADKQRALQQKAYMRNQFEFYGISSPERALIYRSIFALHNPVNQSIIEEVIPELWSLQQRECKYFAIELAKRHIRQMDSAFVNTIEYMICQKSWWDTVDLIATNLVGKLFQKFPELILYYITKWATSENLWLQRTTLLFQIKYKDKTYAALLFKLIESFAGHPDFFIRKAIGWALREYSRTDPQLVAEFVKNHQLSPLSTKEAVKLLKKRKL